MKTADLFELSNDLFQQRQPHAWITVVGVRAPSSAYLGAQAIVTSDGQLHGWIGGGCVQSAARAAAIGTLTSMTPLRLRLSNASDSSEDPDVRPMNCPSNGEIELFIQPVAVTPRLRVYGKTPVARAAAWLAREADFDTMTDADAEDVTAVLSAAKTHSTQSQANAATPPEYALIATQGDGDETALETALQSPASAVLVIASGRKAERLRAAMAARGIPEARLAAIRAPAGPHIGAVTPTEIALSAIAGLVALRRGRLTEAGKRPESAPLNAPNAVGYVNPVCGAAVDPARALSTLTLAGQTHYFCCEGCRVEFERNPDKYLAIAGHMRTPATPE